MHARTHARTHSRTHARMHTRTHTHTHDLNIHIFYVMSELTLTVNELS